MSKKITSAKFRDDMENFLKLKYWSQFTNGKHSIIITHKDMLDYDHEHSTQIYDALLNAPERFISVVGDVTKSILQLENNPNKIRCRIESLPTITTIADAKKDISVNKIITVEGVVNAVGDIMNDIEITYTCENGHTIVVSDNDKVPNRCKLKSCGSANLQKADTSATSYQSIYITEKSLSNKNHYVLRVMLREELIDTVKHGDKIRITGIGKLEPVRKEWENVLHANNVEWLNRQNIEITESDKAVFETFANRPDAYSVLVNSVASSILGREDIKESILLQMVGSEKILLDDNTTRRGEINILLLGDPGLAKSQILLSASMSTPGGIFASGTGSSGLGLTAGMRKMPDGTSVVEAGAVVLANGSLCAIDEFDKLKPEDRDKLHVQMEQNIVPVHKIGGIDTNYDANTAILAAANPIGSYYDVSKSIYDNVDIKPSLLTRFDYVWIFRDMVDKEQDKELAEVIINTYNNNMHHTAIEIDFMLKYIAYAKSFKPTMPSHVKDMIVEFYSNMRKTYEGNREKFNVTPRHLESIIRSVKARARCLLKNEVDDDDCATVFELYKRMLKSANFEVITPSTYIDKAAMICIEYLKANDGPITPEQLYEKIRDQSTNLADFLKDFGESNNTRSSWKYRKIIERVRNTASIITVNRKPLQLAYDHMQASLDSKSK